MKKITAILGLVLLSSSFAFADSYCIGSGQIETEFGMYWRYTAKCSWLKDSFVKTTFAFVGFVSDAKKEKIEREISSQLAKVGVNKVLTINGLDIFSNVSLYPEAQVCIINVFSNHNLSRIIGCTKNANLVGDALNIPDSRALAIQNGFKKVSTIENLFLSGILTEIYVK